MREPKGPIVARFRSNLRPVNRIKHVIDIQIAVPVNTQLVNVVANAVDTPSLGTPIEVAIGSTINGIFLTVEGITTESATGKTPNFYMFVAKDPGSNLTFPNGNAVGANDNKRFIIHQEMVMLQGSAGDDGVPRNIFKGVVVIPKGYRRMGPGDQIVVALFIPSTGVAVSSCMQVHYKEFR